MRFLGTVISGDADFVCISSGGASCQIHVKDIDGLTRGDVSAGFYFAF